MVDITPGKAVAASPSSAPRTVVSVMDLNPRKFGSMEEYMALLSRALQERGWRSVFVLPKAVSPEILPHFEGCGAIFEIAPELNGGKGFWSLHRRLRKHAPDVVHFHFYTFFSLYPIVASLSGARLIVFSQHSRLSETASRTRGLKGFLWDLCVLRPTRTRILTVAAHLKSTLVDAYRLNRAAIQVLYNGVNLHRFLPAKREDASDLRREFGIGASSPVVLAAAYLVPGKGIRDLISAAPAVVRDQESTIFVVVGDGPELEPLRQLARELGVAEAFRFPGLRSDVNRFMALADVVVVPSVYRDSAPLGAVEAMAAARPVVATRVGGLPELVADGVTGILVDPQAPQQLASALLRLLTEPGLAAAMGSAGRERAEKYYSADRWINDTIVFYEENLS
jgi:glycosyltransferase involved in cell wall biosynthesis